MSARSLGDRTSGLSPRGPEPTDRGGVGKGAVCPRTGAINADTVAPSLALMSCHMYTIRVRYQLYNKDRERCTSTSPGPASLAQVG